MRKEDRINVNGVPITIKELTVAEVRHWMMDMIEKEKSTDESEQLEFVLDQKLFEDIGISDIVRMTDLTADVVRDFTPSEFRTVIERCKVLNPDFFGMRKRVLGNPSSRV